ncbi:MAG: DivIVA domain-containing protein [Ilumatobacteraceae bacterium]
MALDIQRPDPSSPAAIASAQFTMSRRGYSEDEVRDFLRQVSVEVSRLIERERFLQSELKALQSRGPMDMSAVDEATVTELLGAEAARVLSAAREAAQAMRDRAAESAENIVREASREAARVLEEATTEASRRRTDVTTEAEQEIELAKEQGREMVAEVRAYRERVLADLARRTDEARRELERLVQERDRLISAFERARSAASGVVGDLNAFDEAIRDAGIVPPLAPPDAPPPPRPTRDTDAQFFDVRKFEDQNADNTPDRGIVVEPEASTTTEASDSLNEGATSTTADGMTNDNDPVESPTDELVTAEPNSPVSAESNSTVATEPEPTAPPEPAATSESAATSKPAATPDEPMAEVVSLFDRRRKKDVSPTAPAVTPLHPAFERVEATPQAPNTSATPSTDPQGESRDAHDRVDELFQRLRASSSRRVATETTKDLAKSTPSEPTSSVVSTAPVMPKLNQSVFEHRAATITAVLDAMVRIAKRVLADDENAIITHVGGKRTSLSPDAVLHDLEQQSRRYADALREELTSIAVEAARTIQSARRADLRTSALDGVVEGVAHIIVSDLLRQLHERVRAALESHVDDRDAIIGEVRSTFKQARSETLTKVVTDVAHFAYARGVFTACDTAGKVCWVVDANGPACADAEDNALAGAIRHGEAFPTGQLHPLAHDGCRCLVIPADK